MGAGRQRVVVVGGSFAGARVHLLLQAQAPELDVLLVDEKEFWEYTPGILRCLVEPDTVARLLVPHAQDTIVAQATSITLAPGGGGLLHLQDHSPPLPWDHLVLATGSSYAPPIKAAAHGGGIVSRHTRVAELHAAAARIAAAHSVVVVGGGAVGVELAAELAGAFGTRKAITLVTAAVTLLPDMAPRAGRYASRWLASRGVRLLLGSRVVQMPQAAMGPGRVLTTCGTAVDADLVIDCTGLSAGALRVELYAELMKAMYGSGGAADEHVAAARRTGVPVSPYLQVRDAPGVWAVGDVAGLQGGRTAYAADLQANCVATNIMRSMRREPLLAYPAICFGPVGLQLAQHPVQAVVSLHIDHGILQVSRTVVCGRLPALMKVMIQEAQLVVAGRVWRIGGLLWLVVEFVSSGMAALLARCTTTW